MDMLALILSIIGSINWGLVGIFKFDLVAWIFGGQTAVVSRIIYTIVGLAGLWCISLLPAARRRGRCITTRKTAQRQTAGPSRNGPPAVCFFRSTRVVRPRPSGPRGRPPR